MSNESKYFYVNICFKETKCSECGIDIYRGDFFLLDSNHLCITCADLDHLVYLPAGNAALTRRAKKHSNLSAIVMKYSRKRKRNERQGIIVEEEALKKAQEECLTDEEIREKRRERDAERRDLLDKKYIEKFAKKLRELYPNCPENREHLIAEHACLKHSGRIGRSADAKEFSNAAIDLAVIAHIRHHETNYDHYLAVSLDRETARDAVKDEINRILTFWS